MIFALNYLNNRELVAPKLSCHLRISKSLIALLFRCSMNVSSRTRLQGGIQMFCKALALATTCILFCRMLCSAA